MSTVTFRDFEERDIDFIYRCKNDEKLNSMIVGDFHPFSYEEATKWVYGCMGEHESFRFWAICTNDNNKRIVGWVSLSEIDYKNRSANFHGIVIGDKNFQDGFAWIESYLFIMSYVFDVLNFNRLYGSSIVGHSISNNAGKVFLWAKEGLLRQSFFKNGQYYDVQLSAILLDEYKQNKSNGAYTIPSILKRIRQITKMNN